MQVISRAFQKTIAITMLGGRLADIIFLSDSMLVRSLMYLFPLLYILSIYCVPNKQDSIERPLLPGKISWYLVQWKPSACIWSNSMFVWLVQEWASNFYQHSRIPSQFSRIKIRALEDFDMNQQISETYFGYCHAGLEEWKNKLVFLLSAL